MIRQLPASRLLVMMLWLGAAATIVRAQQPGLPVVIAADGMGGLNNCRMEVNMVDRMTALFAGDTFDLHFQPNNGTVSSATSWYTTDVVVTSRRYNRVIFQQTFDYGRAVSDRADSAERNLPAAFVQRPDYSAPVQGTIDLNNLPPAYEGMFDIKLDYSLVQFGDSLRLGRFGSPAASPFTIQTAHGTDVNLAPGTGSYGDSGKGAGASRIPSIGQLKLEIEFLPGGTETLHALKNGKSLTFPDVRYLTMRVRNIAQYVARMRGPNGADVDSLVTYSYELPTDLDAKLKADTTSWEVGLRRVITPGSYGVYAYGWLNPTGVQANPTTSINQFNRAMIFLGVPNDTRSYLGTPNRYYLDGPELGVDTIRLKLTHALAINGAEIYLDFAGMGATTSYVDARYIPHPPPARDFQAGDKVIVEFTGGTLGLPMPGASMTMAIPESIATAPPSDDPASAVSCRLAAIAPNPVRGVATLGFELARTGAARITLHTAAGEAIAVLADEVFTGGSHSIEWDSRGIPSGVYLLSLTSGGSTATQRVVVVQ